MNISVTDILFYLLEMEGIKDIYPLIKEYTGRNIPTISSSWKKSLQENDKEILRQAFDKYKTFYLLDIELPVKDIYDVARAALYADDVNTVRDLMFNYSSFLPIEWCLLTQYAYGYKMLRLFDIKGCTGRSIEAYNAPNKINYNIVILISSGLLFESGMSEKEIGERVREFLDEIEYNVPMITEPRKVLLDLEKRGYLKNYPVIHAILHDDYNIYPDGDYRKYPITALNLGAKDIYYEYIMSYLNEVTTLDEYARGSLLLDLINENGPKNEYDAYDGTDTGFIDVDRIDIILSLYPDILDEDRRKSLVYQAAEHGYLHLLNRYIKSSEFIQVGILYNYSSVYRNINEPVYKLLDTKGFRLDWLRYYTESPIMRKKLKLMKPPSEVWKKIIATIFGDEYLRDHPDRTNPVLKYIVEEHKNEITPLVVQKLAKLSGKDIDYVIKRFSAWG